MLPPELQPRSHRPPYISTSMSAPSFPTTTTTTTSEPNPNYSNTNTHTSVSGSRSRSRTTKTTSSSLSSSSRYSPSSFVHNGRIAFALVPCAAFLLDLGGTPVVAALILGLMLVYILDSLNFKSASFFAVWFTLVSAQIVFFISSTSSLYLTFSQSVPLTVIALFLCAFSNFLLGVWASIQFKWIQIEYPTIVLALERLLFACIPFVASALFTWATVSAIGMSPNASSSYYLMSFSCLFYWLFSIPRVSSFKLKQEILYHGGQVPTDNLILTDLESCVQTLHLLFSPLLFHIASRHSVLFSSASSISDLCLLFFIPFLFQLYASTRGALWWLTKNEHQIQSIRLVNGAVALVVVVVCLEIRVVFHSFAHYLHVPPPFSYFLVTVTMLGGAVGAAACALGIIADALSSIVFTGLAVLVSGSGAIVVGFPILVIFF